MQNYMGGEPELDIVKTIRRGLLDAGTDSGAGKIQPQMPSPAPAPEPSAIDNLLNMAKPMTPKEQSIAEHGKGGHIARSIGGYFLGDSDMFTKDAYKDQYKADSARYGAVSAMKENMPAFRQYDAMMRDDDKGNDSEAMYMMNKMFGADDNLMKQMYGEYGNRNAGPAKPKWETKFNNGVLYRVDTNGTQPAQPVLDDEGNQITEKMDGDMRKTSGWFKRAVPALENMHKLEDRGVDIDRKTLTLLAQAAQNEDGIITPQLFNSALNDLQLSPDQRQYIRNARDLAMIQLRKESGAAIGVSEMFNELEQNMMLDDFSDEGYEYQRASRGRKYRALSEGMPSYLVDEYTNKGYFDTLNTLRDGSARVSQEDKKYTGPTDFTGKTVADIEALKDQIPSGTIITMPDGSKRRVP